MAVVGPILARADRDLGALGPGAGGAWLSAVSVWGVGHHFGSAAASCMGGLAVTGRHIESAETGGQSHRIPWLRMRKGVGAALSLELRHHLPFTVAAAAATTVVAALLSSFGVAFAGSYAFPGFHFGHLFLSAVASSAVSWRQRASVGLSLAVGTVSSVLFCTVSDVLLPFAGGRIAGLSSTLEVELIEAPIAVIGVAALGSAFGFVHLRHVSIYSHSLHVVVSTLASLGYLLTHSSGALFGWAGAPGLAAILFVAVFVPCCLSDLVMPVACTHCDFRDPAHRHDH